MALNTGIKYFLICFVMFFITSCSIQNSEDTKINDNPPATVNFFNESSFRVDIYKNLNPDYFDPTTLVCSVNPGSTYKATVYASTDQVIGDTFFIRYKVLLANAFETGTADIRVDAQRDLSNISFVVEKGKTYTKTIPATTNGQLNFVNGYIIIQNQSSSQVQIMRGYEILHKMNDGGVYLNSGTNRGYYEIPFSIFDATLTINQLKAFGSSYIDFPTFVMKRNKKYSFIINSNNTISGPVEEDIIPFQ